MGKIYLLLALLCIGPVWAEAELFDATSDAVRLTVHGRVAKVDFAKIEPAAGIAAESAADLKRDVSSVEIIDSGVVEPKKGPEAKGAHEAAAPEGEAAEAPAAEGEHGAAAEGGEGEKKAAKKPAKKEEAPAFPTVTIGGKPVITRAMQTAEDVSASTPQGLNGRGMDEMLAHRANIVPYAHSPIKGEVGAPVQVVIFEDLSCAQCLPVLGQIDAALADYTSQTQIIHVHAPLGKKQETNLPAFYGKVAQRVGKFWEYRAALIAGNVAEPSAVFDTLLKCGMRERDVRSLMMTDARRFYRELDADVLLANTFSVGKPPVVFINGIRVGDGGIPMEKLNDVLFYVTQRIARGLPEPGL